MTSVEEKIRSYEEVLRDVIFDDSERNDGCVQGHCVLKQLANLRNMLVDCPRSVNNGCPVKLAVVGLGATPYEIVVSKFIAQLKQEVGMGLGFDIHSDGALRVFRTFASERRFKREFDRYMRGEINVREVYGEVVKGVDLIGVTRRALGDSIRRNGEGREFYERRLAPSMFFG